MKIRHLRWWIAGLLALSFLIILKGVRRIEPVDVLSAYSSWFADERRFPKDTVEFDCALWKKKDPTSTKQEQDK